MHRKLNGSLLSWWIRRCANTASPTSPIRPSRSTPSSTCHRFQPGRGFDAQRISGGATIRAPPMSPSHQVSQIERKSAQWAEPPRQMLVTPTVALTAGLRRPARMTYLKKSRGRSKARRPLANRRQSQAPASASRVLPAAVPIELGIPPRSEEHTSELQSPCNLVCRLLLEKKKKDKAIVSRTMNITTKPSRRQYTGTLTEDMRATAEAVEGPKRTR